MITIYLCGVSVLIAAAIGIPLGILAAQNARAGRVIGGFIDTLQTLPSFVYLIPVVMLFRVGDFAAMIAVVRSEEHTSELQSLMRISYAVFCLKKKKKTN